MKTDYIAYPLIFLFSLGYATYCIIDEVPILEAICIGLAFGALVGVLTASVKFLRREF